MKKGKQTLTWVGGILFSICLIFVALITSFEIGAYGSDKFYEKEYEKYDVLRDVQMEMPDVMYVTKEMMSFLRGDRENLIVDTIVDGQPREFFNEREIAHMDDVKVLFVNGLHMRTGGVILMLLLLATGILTKAPWKRILPKAFQCTAMALTAITAVIALLFATNFTKYFTIFHEIFFSNDLWLLDPETDLLINILPEGFFSDIAARIGVIFVVMLVVLVAVATVVRVVQKKGKAKERQD